MSSASQASKVDMHQIGEVAERVGLSLRTVRYYEEVGLITPEARSEGGFRLYTEENIDRLLTIMQMKPIGLSVEKMREVLDARDTLRSAKSADSERLRAADKLLEFARYAENRCQKLREHLAAGERLAEELSREARQPARIGASGRR